MFHSNMPIPKIIVDTYLYYTQIKLLETSHVSNLNVPIPHPSWWLQHRGYIHILYTNKTLVTEPPYVIFFGHKHPFYITISMLFNVYMSYKKVLAM